MKSKAAEKGTTEEFGQLSARVCLFVYRIVKFGKWKSGISTLIVSINGLLVSPRATKRPDGLVLHLNLCGFPPTVKRGCRFDGLNY